MIFKRIIDCCITNTTDIQEEVDPLSNMWSALAGPKSIGNLSVVADLTFLIPNIIRLAIMLRIYNVYKSSS